MNSLNINSMPESQSSIFEIDSQPVSQNFEDWSTEQLVFSIHCIINECVKYDIADAANRRKRDQQCVNQWISELFGQSQYPIQQNVNNNIINENNNELSESQKLDILIDINNRLMVIYNRFGGNDYQLRKTPNVPFYPGASCANRIIRLSSLKPIEYIMEQLHDEIYCTLNHLQYIIKSIKTNEASSSFSNLLLNENSPWDTIYLASIIPEIYKVTYDLTLYLQICNGTFSLQ